MTCGILKQIAIHCDDKETYCPKCGSTMEEKFLAEHNWLECDNQQCGHTIDLNEVRDD